MTQFKLYFDDSCEAYTGYDYADMARCLSGVHDCEMLAKAADYEITLKDIAEVFGCETKDQYNEYVIIGCKPIISLSICNCGTGICITIENLELQN